MGIINRNFRTNQRLPCAIIFVSEIEYFYTIAVMFTFSVVFNSKCALLFIHLDITIMSTGLTMTFFASSLSYTNLGIEMAIFMVTALMLTSFTQVFSRDFIGVLSRTIFTIATLMLAMLITMFTTHFGGNWFGGITSI